MMKHDIQDPNKNSLPIGIYDSGVGGLSVLREIKSLLPAESLFYFADQAHVPYGQRSLKEIRKFAQAVVVYMLQYGIKMFVVACNTASAAALVDLRQEFPDLIIVGMEPAVKPAAEGTKTGVVGILATPLTFGGELYASVVDRLAKDIMVIEDTCPGLVSQIEAGEIGTEKTRNILKKAIDPFLAQSADRIVLGCTHYPFVIPVILDIVGKKAKIIDPAPAVAKQVKSLLVSNNLLNPSDIAGTNEFLTSGDDEKFNEIVAQIDFPNVRAKKVVWDEENQDYILA